MVADGLGEEDAGRLSEMWNKNACTFREHDIRSAVPELSTHAERVYLCTNSVMAGATGIAYVATTPQTHRAIITRIECKTRSTEDFAELVCDRIGRREAWYREDPKQFFELNDGISFETAAHIISMYQKMGIAGLPDRLRDFGAEEIGSVGASARGVRLTFGRDIRCGCTMTLIVEPNMSDPTGPGLKLAADPEGFCI